MKQDERGAMLLMLAPADATYKPNHPAILVHDTNFADPSLPVYSHNPEFTDEVQERLKLVMKGSSTYDTEFGKLPNVVDVKETHTVGIGVVFPEQGSECSVYYTCNGGESVPIITDFSKAFQKVRARQH